MDREHFETAPAGQNNAPASRRRWSFNAAFRGRRFFDAAFQRRRFFDADAGLSMRPRENDGLSMMTAFEY
jgi:hypothetical protein